VSVTLETLSQRSLSHTRREFSIACFLFFIFAILLFIPVFVQGFPSGHDGYVHYRWAEQFIEALKEPGVFYPRWLSSGNNHSGSPVMFYYPPLPFFFVAFLNLFLNNILRALTLSCLFAFALSGVTMYAFLRSFFSYRISIFAALFYMIAPYHLYDFYHRAALAEFWSFVWLPLLLDAIYRITRRQGAGAVAYLAVSFALLLLTHIPIAYAFCLVLPLYILLLTRDWKPLLQIIAGFLLGTGLSAIFLLPVIFERGYVKFDRVLGIRYAKYWGFEELFSSPLFQLSEENLFYLLKIVDLCASMLPLLLLLSAGIYFLYRSKVNESPLLPKVLLALWSITTICLFMMLRISAPVWAALPQLAYLQFPFRFLTIAALGSASLVAFLAASLLQNARWRIPLGGAFALILLCTCAVSILVIKQAHFERSRLIRPGMTLEVKEYHPVWWEKRKLEDEVDEETVLKMRLPAVIVTSGEATVQALDEEGIQQDYSINANQDATLKFRTLYFPGWHAYLDGREIELHPSKEGYLEVAVESGEHQLRLNFEDTRPRLAGKIISAISLLLTVFLIAIATRQRLKLAGPTKPTDDEAQW
jgi:uncharacterized membrane protein